MRGGVTHHTRSAHEKSVPSGRGNLTRPPLIEVCVGQDTCVHQRLGDLVELDVVRLGHASEHPERLICGEPESLSQDAGGFADHAPGLQRPT